MIYAACLIAGLAIGFAIGRFHRNRVNIDPFEINGFKP